MKKYLYCLMLFLMIPMSYAIANPMRIVIIDSGIDVALQGQDYLCKDFGILDMNKSNTHIPESFRTHGSTILNFVGESIKKTHNTDNYCVTAIVLKMAGDDLDSSSISRAIAIAASLSPVAINMSISGSGFLQSEYESIEKTLRRGIPFFVPMGNDNTDLDKNCNTYPACYKKIIPVGLSSNFHVSGSNACKGISNYGLIATSMDAPCTLQYNGKEQMGTSMSSPIKMVQFIVK